ncbi:N4-gp56 family major capsid protein [Kushneria aurantia]|uniref:N4-gp56 family major capsid protein n=1 Tax=Kushneria aurantia TaxID=504092 RepID=A0ABV6G4Z4_9GAMM|nr:N4-gp56 family major capsid protein [Kushneria aurantia]
MPRTTYGDISQRTAAWAAAKMLSHAEPILVLSKFGQSKPLPKNKADTVKFRRPVPFPAQTTPLAEGVTPTARQMAYEDVTVTIKQWGDVVEITDVVDDLAEDPVLSDASQLCGEQASETIELQTWGALRAGTNVNECAA